MQWMLFKMGWGMVAKRKSIDQQIWWKKLKNHRFIRIFLFVILGIVTYSLLVSNIIPNTLEVETGTVSEADIRSPLTIENKTETERLKQEAYDSVEPVYSLRARYSQNQIERIQDIFHTIKQVKEEVEDRENEIEMLEEELEDFEEEDQQNTEIEDFTDEEKLDRTRNLLAEQSEKNLSDDTLVTLLNASMDDLQMAQETTTSAVYDVMNVEVQMNQVDSAKDEVERKVELSAVSPQLTRAMIEISRYGVTANYMLDDEATAEARELAAEFVEPVMIREGQLIVEEGQVITSEIYQQLSLVGLTEDITMGYPYLGLAIIVSLLITMLAYYLNDAKTSLRSNNTHLLMYTIIYSLTLMLLKLVSMMHVIELDGITYIAPVAMGTMLITILLHSRVALFTSMVFAIVASIMFNNQASGIVDYSHAILVFFSGVAGVFFLSKSHRMMRILQTGIFVSVINVLVVLAILLLKNAQYGWVEIGSNLGFAGIAGFISVVLAIGLLPFFEAGFGILSTTKLIELSNPNHPLLRKILLEAPGTYHHSVIVANLAEGACESVGANGLLARVGAYYHDIGKTRRPHFFIENQMKIDNPHDTISPQLSRTIIIAHPYDGAEMLRKYKMPKELIDIAEQHHGTTLLKYFYHKAKNEESGEEVREVDYRYPGPRAQSKEAAIVGIADCVEAAVRSMQKPTKEKIESLVRKIISDRLKDEQFDECDLTMKELHTIATSICETLQGTFHSRIEYPDDEISKDKEEKE
ncbi:HD family phosphohydrolase [Salipaludibacillus daqingensis]|uniref:HD family phosphohydrolase n=1 Tax=Salipaludibacillus daqingensis TaxID=3041001 RepID=UPI0024753A15|nr:HD family phosphohydrolase [Salipaludibacillus daqingensis]